ncbi:DUF5004 domain-containing protein [Flagellimonas olearia]|uniref:DUF5004 domain-containing protein n=1 Tax=Flagellimonas olearia TaxID=552546 RepID=A0A6I1E2B9_9FLAO|nr:DUF5004 domain-containing protein [Allomuricauda olearia]KAB7530111.1 DUF5004 domain-containing protein [Allomuricauda olearia]
MKKNAFVCLAALVTGIFITSCTSDDGEDCPGDFTGALDANEQKLIGTWILSSIVSMEEVDITDDGEDNPSNDIYAQYSDCQKSTFYTFNSNRIYQLGQSQSFEGCEKAVTVEGSWQLTSQTLGLVRNCTLQNIGVVFSADETRFSFSGNYTVTEENGNIVQTDITFTYTLTP